MKPAFSRLFLAFLTIATVQLSSVTAHAGNGSAKSCTALLERASRVEKVQSFVTRQVPYLRSELEANRRESDAKHVLHMDPLACRFCSIASRLLAKLLVVRFPNDEWVVRRTRGGYQGFLHDYVYSPTLNLMVDATYRQFLAQDPPALFHSLPIIFVGTPEEFRRDMKPYFPKDVLDGYVDRTQVIAY